MNPHDQAIPLPELSVVIPNYNHARYLPTCLKAIVSQSIPAAEILVIDDASTDDSVAVIEQFALQHSSIRLIKNDQNRGVVFGMNRGLDLATHEYIYFAAADDEALPGLFEKSLRLLALHPQAALSCTIGDWREVSTGLNWHVGVGMADRPAYLAPEQLAALERSSKLFIASHTAIMRRDAIIEAGEFIPELRMHCDWFAMYMAAFRYGICHVPEPLGIANIHPRGVYTGGIREREAYRDVLRRILDFLLSERYSVQAEYIRQSGGLFHFGTPMLSLILAERQYRQFLTPAFLRKNLWHIFKLEAKKFTPRFAAEWYFRLAGYKHS